MCNIGIRPEEGHKVGSKVGVSVCQLEGESREYEVEIATVLEVARAKEGRSKAVLGEDTFGNGLSDRRFPCPCKTVQPEDRRLVEVLGP